MQRIYRQLSIRQTAAVLAAAGLQPASAQQAIQAQAVRAAATQAQSPGSEGVHGAIAWTALATAVLSSVGLYTYTQQRSSALCEEQRASSGQTVVCLQVLITHKLLACHCTTVFWAAIEAIPHQLKCSTAINLCECSQKCMHAYILAIMPSGHQHTPPARTTRLR